MTDQPEFERQGELYHAVMEAIAKREGVDVSALDPPTSVDLEALDEFFVSAADSAEAVNPSATFRHEEWVVSVDQHDGVTIRSDGR
jgi:hypothetical protein